MQFMYVHLEAYTFMEEGNNETKIKNKYKDNKSNMFLSMNFTIKMFKKSELKYKNLVFHIIIKMHPSERKIISYTLKSVDQNDSI